MGSATFADDERERVQAAVPRRCAEGSRPDLRVRPGSTARASSEGRQIAATCLERGARRDSRRRRGQRDGAELTAARRLRDLAQTFGTLLEFGGRLVFLRVQPLGERVEG